VPRIDRRSSGSRPGGYGEGATGDFWGGTGYPSCRRTGQLWFVPELAEGQRIPYQRKEDPQVSGGEAHEGLRYYHRAALRDGS
jgi:hypothetical protein